MMMRWHRQQGESRLWYGRFLTYLELGPGRSAYAAYVATQQAAGKETAGSAPGAWNRTAQRDQWSQRAAAYDDHLQERAATALTESMTALLLAGPTAAKKLVDLLQSESEEQARHAANSILNRIGAIHVAQPDDDGRPQIQTIVVAASPAHPTTPPAEDNDK